MAVFEKLVWAFRCERCGAEWLPRKLWSEGDDLPTVCPSCKSPYWNRARLGQPESPPANYVQVASIPGWQDAFQNGVDPADGNLIYGLWRQGPGRYVSVRLLTTREGEVQVQTVEPTQKRPRETKWASVAGVYVPEAVEAQHP